MGGEQGKEDTGTTGKEKVTSSAIREIAEVIYKARLKEAFGKNRWELHDKWPKDDKAWRAYPHNPNASVDLAIASADALHTRFVITDKYKIRHDGLHRFSFSTNICIDCSMSEKVFRETGKTCTATSSG